MSNHFERYGLRKRPVEVRIKLWHVAIAAFLVALGVYWVAAEVTLCLTGGCR